MHRVLEHRLKALEEQSQEDSSSADLLAPRVVDYRTLLDPDRPQTGPVVIRWLDYAASDTTQAPLRKPMNYRDIARRLQVLEEQAQPERAGYAVQIGNGPDAIVTVNAEDIPLAEFERRYPDAVTIDIGGPSDATYTV